jgi:hypothetical protein
VHSTFSGVVFCLYFILFFLFFPSCSLASCFFLYLFKSISGFATCSWMGRPDVVTFNSYTQVDISFIDKFTLLPKHINKCIRATLAMHCILGAISFN